jgi:hypothetical protein
MDHSQSLGLALATTAVLGLSACGGSNDVATNTPAAAVACTAPDVSTDFAYGTGYASVCVPASSGGGSSRYDAVFYGNSSAVNLYKVDFSNATCTENATNPAFASARANFASSTTTVAGLGADGVTPVTGSGRTVTLSMFSGEGTFPAGTPFIGDGQYVLCKTTPASTTTSRTLSSFQAGEGVVFTPTFTLRASNVGTNAINTGFGFDGRFALFD